MARKEQTRRDATRADAEIVKLAGKRGRPSKADQAAAQAEENRRIMEEHLAIGQEGEVGDVVLETCPSCEGAGEYTMRKLEQAKRQQAELEAELQDEEEGQGNDMARLVTFQKANCQRCYFSVKPKIGTGENCCIAEQPETDENGMKCLTRAWHDTDEAANTAQQDQPIEEEQDAPTKPETRVVKAEPVSLVEGPTASEQEAIETKEKIRQLATTAQAMFLEIGELLYKVREEQQWVVLGYESFKDYIDELDLPMTNSYSWATRMLGIHEHLTIPQAIPQNEMVDIGVTKLVRILPVARKGELTEELIEKTKSLSDRDLRTEIGHKIRAGSTEETSITCPHCGHDIHGAKWAAGRYEQEAR